MTLVRWCRRPSRAAARHSGRRSCVLWRTRLPPEQHHEALVEQAQPVDPLRDRRAVSRQTWRSSPTIPSARDRVSNWSTRRRRPGAPAEGGGRGLGDLAGKILRHPQGEAPLLLGGLKVGRLTMQRSISSRAERTDPIVARARGVGARPPSHARRGRPRRSPANAEGVADRRLGEAQPLRAGIRSARRRAHGRPRAD